MKHISSFLSTLFIFGTAIVPILGFDNSPVLAQTSGCGSGASWYLSHVVTPISAQQFRVACNEHDACYDTLDKTKAECDRAFHNRMLGICARDHNTILGRPLRIRCNGFADAFYTAVLERGGDPYNSAQNAAFQRLSFSWSQAGAIPGLTCKRVHLYLAPFLTSLVRP